MKNKLSIVVIVGGDYDKKLYQSCKKSLNWADEVIEIKHNPSKKESFADWRNSGIKKAKGDWILYVDTDEEVSTSLKKEISLLLKKTKIEHNAYAIPRRNIIFGKEFKHGGQTPDYQKRLFKKIEFEKWTGDLHEEPHFNGSMGHLKSKLIHHKNMSLSQMVEKTNSWSEIEAREMYKAKHPNMNAFRFFTAAFREFWLRFVRQLCFLDGTKGVIYGMFQIYSRLISYSKLWEMQIK